MFDDVNMGSWGNRGAFSRAMRDNADVIQGFFGSLDNIMVARRYNDFVKKLNKFEKNKLDNIRYVGLAKKFADAPFSFDDAELYNTATELDTSDTRLPTTEFFKKYREYYEALPEEDRSANKYQTTQEFFDAHPELHDELKGLGVLRDKKSLKSADEIKAIQYKNAQFTPEDVAFFEAYKPEDIQKYNYDLVKKVPDYGSLISRGSRGDTYAKQFMDKLAALELKEPPPPKWETKMDARSGNFIMYNVNNPSQFKVMKYADGTGANTKPYAFGKSSTVQPFIDENGVEQYGYFEPDPTRSDYGLQGWRFTGVLATPVDIQEYKDALLGKKKGGSLRKGGIKVGSPKKVTERTAAELQNLTVEDVSKLGVGQLQQLLEYEDMLSPAVREWIYKQLGFGDDGSGKDKKTQEQQQGQEDEQGSNEGGFLDTIGKYAQEYGDWFTRLMNGDLFGGNEQDDLNMESYDEEEIAQFNLDVQNRIEESLAVIENPNYDTATRRAEIGKLNAYLNHSTDNPLRFLSNEEAAEVMRAVQDRIDATDLFF